MSSSLVIPNEVILFAVVLSDRSMLMMGFMTVSSLNSIVSCSEVIKSVFIIVETGSVSLVTVEEASGVSSSVVSSVSVVVTASVVTGAVVGAVVGAWVVGAVVGA